MSLQDELHALSLADPEAFWSGQAALLHWHKKPSSALQTHTTTYVEPESEQQASRPAWTWFPDGEISTCYNCVDRHAATPRDAARPAIFWDSPVTGRKRRISYGELLDEVGTLAAVLREEGVGRGDVVLVYMPNIPATIVALLAINRLGAVHAVVFGGFAAPALAQRIDACRPAIVLTVSASIDGTKPPIPFRPLVRDALRVCAHCRPRRVVVWERQGESAALAAPGIPWTIDTTAGERSWQALVASAQARGLAHPACVAVRSDEPVYVMHTSGTTGRPKGVVRNAGGHAVGLHLSMAYVYGVRGPGDVMLTTADIGWVISHSFTVYGPLLRGAAAVLYEGKPVGTPDAGAYWRLVEEYGVCAMLTAPTALRAIDRDDGGGRCLRAVGERGGLQSLKGLFIAGEKCEKPLAARYQGFMTEYGAAGAQVVDHWWTTELGSPATARALDPGTVGPLSMLSLPSRSLLSSSSTSSPPPSVPGSTGKPMPGFDVRIVDDDGVELPRGASGNVVLGLPLPPTAFVTLWGNDGDARFVESYLGRFRGRWLDTGDGGIVDGDGYLTIMGRNDDVLNVSAHRLSSGSIEQAITAHPLVAEAYVVALPDPFKGELPFAFVILSTPVDGVSSSSSPSTTLPAIILAEIQTLVRSQVGAVAALGGAVACGRTTMPRTRSGKTLRRVLREVLAVEQDRWGGRGDVQEREIKIPDTIEDVAAVAETRKVVREYFAHRNKTAAKL